MAVVVNLKNKKYYVHRIVLPDGSAFKYESIKNNAEQEMYQGVPKRSLANTTSSASKNSISQNSENINPSGEKSSKKSSEAVKSGKRSSRMEETDESVADNARETETVSEDEVIVERGGKSKSLDGLTIKERAEMKNNIVYNRAEVSKAVKRIEGVSLLTSKQREEIVEDLWRDLNASDRVKERDGYLEAVARRTTESILNFFNLFHI